MEELYKETPNLPMDVTSPPAAMANNKLENGVAQLITAEAWNINSADLMKKALSPLVTVPAPSILTPPAESQMPAGNATPYVMTTQGPVPLPVLLEQHVFQHLNSPLVLPPGAACPASPLHGGLFPGSSAPVGQPQLLDPKPAGPGQEPVLPPVFQTPGFAAVLQDLFPSGQGALGSAPCQPPPDYAALPPQAFSSPLSPLVPPATLLVPYPVIVPLPVPVPIPIPVPIPVPHGAESKVAPDPPKPPLFTPQPCKGTQTPLEKEETKPFDLVPQRDLPQLSRHTVIKMGSDNEALDLSMKGPPAPRAGEAAPPPPSPEDGALDLSLASCRKPGGPQGEAAGTSPAAEGSPPAPPAAPFAPSKAPEATGKAEARAAGPGPGELLRPPQKWLVEPAGRAGCEPKAGGNNIEIVSTSQTAKVIVSVKDAVPTIFCGKIKGLSGVSTKNFSFKRDMPQDSVLQCYDVKSQPEPRDNTEALRKPVKNRSVKLKKMNSPEIHILPNRKRARVEEPKEFGKKPCITET
uniref:Retinoic acid induced 2 n=1 Tax=Cairina moschata TaxID=8855 RepID=A0A8C3BEP9_CAIMO